MEPSTAAPWARAATPAPTQTRPSAATTSQVVLFWPAVLTGAVLLAGSMSLAALVIVLSYAVDSSLPAAAQSALARIYLWKVDQGAGLLAQTSARIIVINCFAALLFAQFGSAAALLEGTLRARYPRYDRLERWSGRRLGPLVARVFPRVGDIADEIAREAAALALAFPLIAVAANGVAIGILLGSTALAGSHSLAAALGALWPHGVLEIPALLLAAGVGYAAGLALLEAGHVGLSELLAAARGRLTSGRVWMALIGIFGLLVVAGSVEPTPSEPPGIVDRTARGAIIGMHLR